LKIDACLNNGLAANSSIARRAESQGNSTVWRPLRSATFRNLLLADVISDIGTFMQSVGADLLAHVDHQFLPVEAVG
jgi:hypothetical protein